PYTTLFRSGLTPAEHAQFAVQPLEPFPVLLLVLRSYNRATRVTSLPGLRCRHLSRQAFSDSDSEDVRDNSFAEQRSSNRESGNCGPVVSSSRRGSPDP